VLANQTDLRKIISTVTKIFQEQGNHDISRILNAASFSSEMVHYDNWNGGTKCYVIFLELDFSYYSFYEKRLKEIEELIKGKIEQFLRGIDGEVIWDVVIKPVAKNYIDWTIVNHLISRRNLIEYIKTLSSIMSSVATGGANIDKVNEDYIKQYKRVNEVLEILKIENPNPYHNLWEWYSRWKSDDLQTYKSRRIFIIEMYRELLETLEDSSEDNGIVNQPYELTGWIRVDRSVSEIRKLMIEAKNEEQFQAIGLISRETIISLGQEVYDREIHGSVDGVIPSNTDAKRMLEAFVAFELTGSSNEAYRKYVKAALSLANDLTHRRTASIHEASICVIAVISLVNIIKVITNRSNINF
jgi:hypothetical protein